MKRFLKLGDDIDEGEDGVRDGMLMHARNVDGCSNLVVNAILSQVEGEDRERKQIARLQRSETVARWMHHADQMCRLQNMRVEAWRETLRKVMNR